MRTNADERWTLLPLVVAAWIPAGCNDDSSPGRVCEAGRVVSCPCASGETGTQTCFLDGSGWGDCECPGADAEADADATADDGGIDDGGIDDGGIDDGGIDDGGPEVVEGAPGSACTCDSDCDAVGTHPGVCVRGICMTRPSAPCSGSGSTDECAPGSRCWGLVGYAEELCWPDCTAYGCAGGCDSDGSCVPTAGMDCETVCGSFCCVPDCDGRQCGPSGCGGDCAPGCTAGEHCTIWTGRCQTRTPCTDPVRDCGADAYCQLPIDWCGPEGWCEPRPSDCPSGGDPVCGCMREDFASACHAALAGQAVGSEGPCSSYVCTGSGNCPPDEYCALGIAGSEGCADAFVSVCVPRPTSCPGAVDPVCGCNGVTYDNECRANMAGVRPARAGACS